MDKTRLGVFIVIFGIGALLGLSLGMFWALKLFDFVGTDASARVIAASIAAVGVLFTAMVSLVGLLFRWSVDRGRLLLEQQSHEQRKIEMDATNKRLNMEASMKAVELFKSATGSATPAERAGALFALTGMGKHTFSMTLLYDLLEKGDVAASPAIHLIDQALVEGDAYAQQAAAEVLRARGPLLVNSEGRMMWPDHILHQWMPELDGAAKHLVLRAFLEAVIRHPLSLEVLAFPPIWLTRLLMADSDERLKHNAAYALNVFLKPIGSLSIQRPDGGEIHKAEMQSLAEKESGPVSSYIDGLAPQLEAWIKGESVAKEESAPQEPPSDEAPEEN